ncbi:MAG TPA: uroporphyrinogen-III synthase, partial [Pirellulales bacterium]
QPEINARLVAESLAGRCVARLKGGDPAIFGRLAEELDALDRNGVPYEIVPGVSAAQAAASYAGAPLTDREDSSAVAFVAGHEDNDKTDSFLDYAALAKFPGTLVFYMGVTTAGSWSRALIEHGRPSDEPAVIVRRVSWPDQRVYRTTLAGLPEALDQRRPDRIRPPALVIVGPVAGRVRLDAWFTRRPLFGRTVLVTRAAEQAGRLVSQLGELGAAVLTQPAISIGEPDDFGPLDAALDRLGEFDWIVFSSTNGVQAFCERLWQKADVRRLGSVKLAAIGPATAEALQAYRLRCDLTPAEFRAESLAAALASQAAGRKFLLVRASRGREILAEELSRAGGIVEQVVAYASRDVTSPDPDVLAALEAGKLDWTTVSSSAIARSLVALFGEKLRQTKLASISPITSGVLRECGFEPAAEASVYTLDGLIEAVRRAES